MSSWQSTKLVAARELREAMRRRTFWIVIGVLFVAPAIAYGVLVVQRGWMP